MSTDLIPQQQEVVPPESWRGKIKNLIWENILKPHWGSILFIIIGLVAIIPIFNCLKYKIINIKLEPKPLFYHGNCEDKEDITIKATLYGKGILSANMKYFYANQFEGKPISDTFDIVLNSDTIQLKSYNYEIGDDSKIHIGYIINHKNSITSIFSKFGYNFDEDGVMYSKEQYNYECLDIKNNEVFIRGGITSQGDTIKDFIVLQNEVSLLDYENYAKSKGLIIPQPTEYNYPSDDVDKDNFPITNIAWKDAQTYCESLGGKLPTIKQFKYLLQGGIKKNEKNAIVPHNPGINSFHLSTSNAISVKNINGNAVEWCFDGSKTNSNKKAIMGGMSFDFKTPFQVQYLQKDYSLPKIGFRYVKSIKKLN
jgi:hypothetical protein